MGRGTDQLLELLRLQHRARLHERRALVIEAFVARINAVIVIRRLICEAWKNHHWDGRPRCRP
ncbi:hypothetical protein [Promicromonospora sp. NPDC057488]|uniref:hypothetical protein n=1 Tax=Promicromonospora sp. NPDC057488 TaxID=3346147 RepID=UPI0036734A3D